MTHCLLAPNGCTASIGSQCVEDSAMCSTGQAGGSGKNLMCPLDVPTGAIANGAAPSAACLPRPR
jgi:hypothetical protein